MDVYNIALYAHLLTVAGAFFAVGLIVSAILRLRAAATVGDALTAASTAAKIGMSMPIVTLLLLVTGGLMVQSRWAWNLAWVDVSIVGLLLVTAIGGGFIGSRERAIHAKLESCTSAMLSAELLAAVRDPGLMGATGVNIGLVSAVMFVMVAKGSLLASIATLVVGALLGLGIMTLLQRGEVALAQEEAVS